MRIKVTERLTLSAAVDALLAVGMADPSRENIDAVVEGSRVERTVVLPAGGLEPAPGYTIERVEDGAGSVLDYIAAEGAYAPTSSPVVPTARVRIAVAMTPGGTWYAHGGLGVFDRIAEARARAAAHVRPDQPHTIHWIEADVPIRALPKAEQSPICADCSERPSVGDEGGEPLCGPCALGRLHMANCALCASREAQAEVARLTAEVARLREQADAACIDLVPLCERCQCRSNSRANARWWSESGCLGVPIDPAPRHECKDHEGYGIDPPRSRVECRDFLPLVQVDGDAPKPGGKP